jgi:tryptophan synthase alpha chain
MVSSFSITGAVNSFNNDQKNYFKRINSMKLKSKLLIGFGISNNKTFLDAIKNSRGAIIGSAFIKFLKNNNKEDIVEFINLIREKSPSKH